MQTLLVVDDDKIVRTILKDNLEEEGFLVIEAANGKRMMDVLSQHPIDLVLLDLHLPDGSAENFIPDLRLQTNAPLIIISGETCMKKQTGCLDFGADDYICKPFDVQDVNARIRANLRRFQANDTWQNNHPEPQNFSFHGMTLDPERYQLLDRENQPIDLTMREYLLIEALYKNLGEPVRREDLCESIREDNYIPTPRAIDVKITRLRKKLGDDATCPQIIRTIRCIGYMLDRGHDGQMTI